MNNYWRRSCPNTISKLLSYNFRSHFSSDSVTWTPWQPQSQMKNLHPISLGFKELNKTYVISLRRSDLLLNIKRNAWPPCRSLGPIHEGDPHGGQLLPYLIRPVVLLVFPCWVPLFGFLQHCFFGQSCSLQSHLSQLKEKLKGEIWYSRMLKWQRCNIMFVCAEGRSTSL